MSMISTLPLQEMIAGVVETATQKLASENADADVRRELGDNQEEESTDEDEDLEWTNPAYVEKLASACDFIAENVDNIATPDRGVLGRAIEKLSNEQQAGLPSDQAVPVPPTNPQGALEVTTGLTGTQKYKHEKPAGEDAATPTTNTPETSADLPGGSTQMQNNMEKAPGQDSGSVPKAEYPVDGPLHSGPTKTADGGLELLRRMGYDIEKDAGAVTEGAKKGLEFAKNKLHRYGQLMAGGKKMKNWGKGKDTLMARPGNVASSYRKGLGTKLQKARREEAILSAKTRGATAGGLAAVGLGAKALSGKDKKAGAAADAAKGALGKLKRYGQLLAGGKKMKNWGRGKDSVLKSRPGNVASSYRKGLGTKMQKARREEAILSAKARGATAGGLAAAGLGAKALGGKKGKKKTAAEVAREKILRKLAGEDVMQANISASKSGGPLVGDGEMDAYQAEQVPSNPTDGSGYGNDARSYVRSNQGAISYTKGQAKKKQVPQLGELLTNPAFSAAHDNKLREQLRNAGKAGVKIAGAEPREILKQAAAQGLLTQEMVDQIKLGQFGGAMGGGQPPSAGGGGMTAMAAGDESEEEMERKRKLKALTEKQSGMGCATK